MKVIRTDSFNRESQAEKIIKDNLSTEEAKSLCDELIAKRQGENDPNWYKVADDDYRLWRGMEKFI